MGHIQYRQKHAPQWAEGNQSSTDDAGDGEGAFIHRVWERWRMQIPVKWQAWIQSSIAFARDFFADPSRFLIASASFSNATTSCMARSMSVPGNQE